MTLEFKFNAAFPDVELHERGQWRRASGYAGKWARSGCGPEKIPADDGDDDGRLNEEEECCCFVARDGPRGEVWCVREWVKEDSGPSSSVLQIASCQVTERDLLPFRPLPRIPRRRHCFMFTAPKEEEE